MAIVDLKNNKTKLTEKILYYQLQLKYDIKVTEVKHLLSAETYFTLQFDNRGKLALGFPGFLFLFSLIQKR